MMKMMAKVQITAFLLASFLLPIMVISLFAKDRPYIPVGQARTKKTVLAFAPIAGEDDARGLIKKTMTKDLAFMDAFRFVPPAAFNDISKEGLTPETFRFSNWSNIGTEFLIKSGLSKQKNLMTYELYLYDVRRGEQVLAKKYVGKISEARIIAHSAANDIVHRLTGLPGIFLTKIAMSCDRSRKKEIYVMNFDGSDVKQITHHRSISFAPAWSPDGSRLAYSVYTRHKGNKKNIDLYEYSFINGTIRLLSNRKGINSGAAYSPDGRTVALTMSFLGNPEIFALNPGRRNVRRMTRSFGFDVDPVWSPDGKKIAFSSSRSGKPMIYVMNKSGKSAQRLTYAGRYNATPSWSPQNNKIAFAGWIDGKFDVFIMNPDGTNIERLTKNQGNNEDPSFSPDGNFIVFSSNRTGRRNVYVMNIDGTFVKRLTYGMGNCVAPKWSAPAPKPVLARKPPKAKKKIVKK